MLSAVFQLIKLFDSSKQIVYHRSCMSSSGVEIVLRCYPRIYFACHIRHVKEEATGNLLSAHQASVLDHLDDVEPTSLQTLARHMGVTNSTMSLTVERLVRGAYVLRERAGDDARRLNLRLTASGAAIKRQQKVLEPERVDAMLQQLSPEDRQAALHGLELLARAASDLIAGGASRQLYGGAK